MILCYKSVLSELVQIFNGYNTREFDINVVKRTRINFFWQKSVLFLNVLLF